MIHVYYFHIFLFYQYLYISDAEYGPYQLIEAGYNQALLFQFCLKYTDIVSDVYKMFIIKVWAILTQYLLPWNVLHGIIL